ncbi:hypothetical protein SPRG_12375 [Saprolegnia parasitica CBS 223.65]|uniref:Protein kinase domain-containing protein n=1 Tax=Saprolegnia parasitica (strain CBS 223.65) TaxID=695850 RepID=A0A067BUC6_SAPPC|nr:hypothetical protein SPRG_12375 [Saprolegnia parasitica CBS 223.65]KDO21873.1 hypothetical protein SPRG_12375 [Saprolegnia parasitica CBS 223.65]|eukprot:XP_012207428.1 hypothetical protein SPRG_12375 [Saprolegnia parasitica CBS 223.65]
MRRDLPTRNILLTGDFAHAKLTELSVARTIDDHTMTAKMGFPKRPSRFRNLLLQCMKLELTDPATGL